MAFDLDDEELRATRRDKGLDKDRSDKNVANDRVIAHKFAVMQQQIDEKDKRIQELEEENKKYIVKLTDEQYKKLVDSIRKEVKQEFEQKVKDKMEELKQLKVQLPVQHMKEAQIIVLQELLRGEEDNGT